MLDKINFLCNTIQDERLEQCRYIITRNSPQLAHCAIQILNLYYDSYADFNLNTNSTEVNSIKLVKSEEVTVPNQDYVDYVPSDHKIYITFDDKYINIKYGNKSYRDIFVVSGEGVVPSNGWPNFTGINGAITKSNGYIYAKIKYPIQDIAQELKQSSQVINALENADKLNQFYTADSDIEKIAIISKLLIDKFEESNKH